MKSQFWYYRIGVSLVRVTVEDEQGEPAPVAAELYDPNTRRFSVVGGLMQRVNSLDAKRIDEAEFYA